MSTDCVCWLIKNAQLQQKSENDELRFIYVKKAAQVEIWAVPETTWSFGRVTWLDGTEISEIVCRVTPIARKPLIALKTGNRKLIKDILEVSRPKMIRSWRIRSSKRREAFELKKVSLSTNMSLP